MVEIFCKTAINEIMPAVRATIAVRMLDLGFTQAEISKRLGITQPAISQYKRRLRGSLLEEISKNKAMLGYIDGLISELTKNNTNLNIKMCGICEKTRKTGVVGIGKNEFLCLLELANKKVN
jgi:hypothetical protein